MSVATHVIEGLALIGAACILFAIVMALALLKNASTGRPAPVHYVPGACPEHGDCPTRGLCRYQDQCVSLELKRDFEEMDE